MLRVAEQYTGTDTGRQRRANEDALLARAPPMPSATTNSGAQAGEVASRIAVEVFQPGLKDAAEPERALAALARVANARIHELSHSNAEQAGMGTTLTAAYVGEHEVAIAHVGDSRAYCLRDGELLRLTDDHTLVDELLRQGRLTPEEAIEHPQRSVITRALGPEGAVEVDTRSFHARADDVYLLCSDGLTTMISEEEILALLLAHPRLHDAGEALIDAANAAGGRDNVTVVLLRLEEVGVPLAAGPSESSEATFISPPAAPSPDAAPEGDATPAPDAVQAARYSPAAVAPPASARPARRDTPARRVPRRAPAREPAQRARGRARRALRHAKGIVIALVALALLGAGADIALQSVYFIGTNSRGLITLFQGVPYQLPGGLDLYSRQYVSGVDASQLAPSRRGALLDHHLRSEGDAAARIRTLELEQLE